MASNISTPQKASDQRSKSCETACSSNSSCFFKRRKPTNPLANSIRSNISRSTANSVRQRVLSAKLLKLKSVQNQLNDVNYHLAEVIRENQALKTLQKRQDKALSKYEGANAELPRLIHSHEEEIRILTEKNKTLRRTLRELSEQIKHKDEELNVFQEQLKHYERLDKDKHLLEREKLSEELEDVKSKLAKADTEIVILNRKLTLESKTSKQRLNAEIAKYKQCQRDLSQALGEINRLTKLLETKDKSLTNGRKRFSNLAPRTSMSLISLNGTKSEIANYNFTDKCPVTEVKLEPLLKLKEEDNSVKPDKSILKCPSQNIKARLSADSKYKDVDEDLPLEKLSLTGSDSSNEKTQVLSRPSSHYKLEKIEMNLHNAIKKSEKNNSEDEFSKSMGDFCLKAVDSIKICTDAIENHRENLAYAREDTDKIIDSVQSVEMIEKRLKNEAKMITTGSASKSEDGFDFVKEILREEAEFQAKFKDTEKREPLVRQNEKKKLLATLRAIDNGDSVESFGDISN